MCSGQVLIFHEDSAHFSTSHLSLRNFIVSPSALSLSQLFQHNIKLFWCQPLFGTAWVALWFTCLLSGMESQVATHPQMLHARPTTQNGSGPSLERFGRGWSSSVHSWKSAQRENRKRSSFWVNQWRKPLTLPCVNSDQASCSFLRRQASVTSQSLQTSHGSSCSSSSHPPLDSATSTSSVCSEQMLT